MTKTPEELTEEWKAGKLAAGYYYIKFKNGEIETQDNLIGGFLMNMKNPIVQVIAPVPTYDEYKAMQAELDEFKRTFTSYVGKPIDYDIACETVNKLLDNKEQLKKELESARWYQTVQNEDIGKLRGLLKECLPIVSAEIMTWQIRGGEESHKRGQELLTRINTALGESEEK